MAAELLVALSFCGVAGLISLAAARRKPRRVDPATPERGLDALLPGDVLDTPSGPLVLVRALRLGGAGAGLSIYYLEAVRGDRDAKPAPEKPSSSWVLAVSLGGLSSSEGSPWLLTDAASPSLPIKDLSVDTAPSELYHQGLRHRLSGTLRGRARIESLHASSEQTVQFVSYSGPGGSRLLLISGAVNDGGRAEFFAGSVIVEGSLRIIQGKGPAQAQESRPAR